MERIPQCRNTQQKLTWKYLQTVTHFLFLSAPFAEDAAVIGVKLVYRVQPLHLPRTNAQQVAQVTLQQMMVTVSYLERSHDINKHLHTQHCTPTEYKTILRCSQCSGQESPISYRTRWLSSMFIRSTTPSINPFILVTPSNPITCFNLSSPLQPSLPGCVFFSSVLSKRFNVVQITPRLLHVLPIS